MLYLRVTHNPNTGKIVNPTPWEKDIMDFGWRSCKTVVNHMGERDKWMTEQELHQACVKYAADHGEDAPTLQDVEDDLGRLVLTRCYAVSYE
jgi:hypothetical protein